MRGQNNRIWTADSVPDLDLAPIHIGGSVRQAGPSVRY